MIGGTVTHTNVNLKKIYLDYLAHCSSFFTITRVASETPDYRLHTVRLQHMQCIHNVIGNVLMCQIMYFTGPLLIRLIGIKVAREPRWLNQIMSLNILLNSVSFEAIIHKRQRLLNLCWSVLA